MIGRLTWALLALCSVMLVSPASPVGAQQFNPAAEGRRLSHLHAHCLDLRVRRQSDVSLVAASPLR